MFLFFKSCPKGYQYKYNDKEFQDEMGLNVYDYGARNYDPALGRWMNIDPLAEQSRRYSPYAYALDNPVFYVDPDGMRPVSWSMISTQGFDIDVDTNGGLDEIESRIEKDDRQQRANEAANALMALVTGKTDEVKDKKVDIKFPKDSNYEKDRPRLTKTVKNLHGYVKSNTALLGLLAEYSGFSTDKVLQELEYGKGGTLLTEVLSAEYGQTSADGTMKINLKWANGLEKVKQDKNLQATSYLVAITILHEFVHYGRIKNKLSEGAYEYGRGWEQQFFKGQEIDKENAHKLLKQYGNGWKF